MRPQPLGQAVAFHVLFVIPHFVLASFPNPPIHRIKRASDPISVLNPKWNATTADLLKRNLMLSYDKFTRPNMQGNSTDVKFDPTINHVDLDESSSILTIHCWVKMTWMDEKLKWNESEYPGITTLHLADHEIWQPDVVPYNSAAGSSIDSYGNTHAIVYSSGAVIWVPPAILKVFCELDLRKWPVDSQRCMLKVGSWTYSGMEINLNYSEESPKMIGYIKNSEWEIVDIKQYRNVQLYACCVEPYIDLVFNLTIVRHSPTYKTLIVTPITAIVFMTLATFWLPAGSTEKIALGGTTALIISLFLLYFTQKISAMAGHTPYIVSFYASSLYLVSFSMVISVIVINLATSSKSASIPWTLKSYLSGWLGRILLLDHVNSERPRSAGKSEHDDDRPVMEEEVGERVEPASGGIAAGIAAVAVAREWRLLATAIDRITFLIYCFLFICFALSYLT